MKNFNNKTDVRYHYSDAEEEIVSIEKQITVFYIVGGDEQHYKNMSASVKSLADNDFKGKFLILEIGKKLNAEEFKNKYEIKNEVKVLNRPDEIDFSKPGKKGYLFWKQKYKAALEIETKYGAYVDSDTLFLMNPLCFIAKPLEGRIAATPHFWVPTMRHFEQMAVPSENRSKFSEVKKLIGLRENDIILTGGFFIFETTESNKKIFEETLLVYNEVYSDGDEYVQGLTDEIVFSHVVQTHENALHKGVRGNIALFHGAANHCFMGNQHMPLLWDGNEFIGKNPNESKFMSVMLLHCDISRRDPSENYEGECKTKIIEFVDRYRDILT